MIVKRFETCPFCGTKLLTGHMRLVANYTGALYWKSDHKKPRKNIPAFLKKASLGYKSKSYKLMSLTGIFGGQTSCEGWYCPICRIVVAAFATGQGSNAYTPIDWTSD